MARGPQAPPPPPEGEARRRQTIAVVLGVVGILIGIAGLVYGLTRDTATEVVETPADATATPIEDVASPGVTEDPLPLETAEPIPAGWTRCENTTDFYTIAYPEDWHTVADDPEHACRYFDRDVFELPEDSEPPIVDMQVYQADVPFQQVVDGFVEADGWEVSDSKETEVASRGAVVILAEATEDAPIFPEGTQIYVYVIDRAGTGFVVETIATPEADDFSENSEIVDEAAETLEFL